MVTVGLYLPVPLPTRALTMNMYRVFPVWLYCRLYLSITENRQSLSTQCSCCEKHYIGIHPICPQHVLIRRFIITENTQCWTQCPRGGTLHNCKTVPPPPRVTHSLSLLHSLPPPLSLGPVLFPYRGGGGGGGGVGEEWGGGGGGGGFKPVEN